MSLPIIRNIDFGNVETAAYGYVNMCSGPDYYCFKMKPEDAKPFMEKIDKAAPILNEAMKKIDPKNDELCAACYEEGKEDNEGSIVFTACLLDPVGFGHELVSVGEAVQRIDDILEQEPHHIHIVCDLVADDDGEFNFLMLKLVSFDMVD